MQPSDVCPRFWLGKGREGKGREGKGREGKGREGKGREGKGSGSVTVATMIFPARFPLRRVRTAP
jgi:hypothetical protein